MTIATIGHNGGPDLDGPKQSVRTQWAKALFADPTTPVYVMAIAWAVHWYSNADGSGAALSNEQLETFCGISERTATRGKVWLRDRGYVQLKVGKQHEKTRFQLVLPEVQGSHTVHPDDADVATQSTLEGSHTGHVATQATLNKPRVVTQSIQGSHTGDRRVATQATLSSKDNQDTIQEKRALARGRQDDDRPNLWQEALNPQSGDVVFNNGKLHLLNGARTFWLSRFDGDEGRLDLALIEVAPSLQPNSQRPLQVQVEGRLARIVADRMDRDTRYAKAVTKKAEPSKAESRRDRIQKVVSAALEKPR